MEVLKVKYALCECAREVPPVSMKQNASVNLIGMGRRWASWAIRIWESAFQ